MAKKRGAKRRVGGVPFKTSTDKRRSIGSPSVLNPTEVRAYKRFNEKLYDQVRKNTQLSLSELPGLRLRPTQNEPLNGEPVNLDASNDVIDISKLNHAHAEALKSHTVFAQEKRSTKHIPNLTLQKLCNKGFGVQAMLCCTRCSFQSPRFNLYKTDQNGTCLTNIAAAVAFSKTTVKPSDAAFLWSSLDINGPSRYTMQKNFSLVNEKNSKVLDEALSDNRGLVRDYVSVVRKVLDPVPATKVAHDGQYDKPVFHGYDGHSTSVSLPVLEAETGLNLMVSHAVMSKADGSYEKDAVSRVLFAVIDYFLLMLH